MEGYHEGEKGGDGVAVEKVTATLEQSTKDMQNTKSNRYEAEFYAPRISGDYSIEIHAYDDAGNVGVANAESNPDLLLQTSKWHTPKTNWTASDRFNFEDYNRIKNNLEWIHEEACELWKPFDIVDMGENIYDYVTAWKVKYFNAWEKNIDIINNIILTQDYGFSQEFFENGAFIQWNELNRVEGAILSMRNILERQKLGLRKLSIRLGDFKGVKT